MDKRNANKGRAGEDAAAKYMERRGMRILERNYRRERCELDIIAMDGEVLAVTEVKARTFDTMGQGREAVTRKKQLNIIKATQHFLMERNLFDTIVRFDVAEVDLYTGGIEYIEGAFEL